MFDSTAATLLGIQDFQTGTLEDSLGIGGSAPTWYHKGIGVALKDPQGNHVALSLDEAGFVPNLKLTGLVGRDSFFSAFKIIFDQAKETVILEVNPEARNLIEWKKVPILLPRGKGRVPAGRRKRKR